MREPDHDGPRVGAPAPRDAGREGATTSELHTIIEWLTGVDEAALQDHLATGTTVEDFSAAARLNPKASSITGSICGVRVEDIDDPLMQKIRYLDKLVDELARGKAMDRILRAQQHRETGASGPRRDGAKRTPSRRS